MKTAFTEAAGVEVPLICGAMYPCSNPELVAAVSEAGGLGVVQPLSLVFVHGREFRAGLREIRALTKKPIGVNVLTEKSLSAVYLKRMSRWVDEALEEGVRFFVTALGDPRWVVERVHAAGGVVYHDVIDRRWAEKGLDKGRGRPHLREPPRRRPSRQAGSGGARTRRSPTSGCRSSAPAASGARREFKAMLDLGYAAVQAGTRFIATAECTAHADYKKAILDADEDDVVATERITGVPLVGHPDAVHRAHGHEGGAARAPACSRGGRRSTSSAATTRCGPRSGSRAPRSRARRRATAGRRGRASRRSRTVEPAGEIVRRFAAAAG